MLISPVSLEVLGLRVVIVRDYDDLSRKAASIIAKEIRSKPNAVLGLATGSTPLGTYKELVRMYRTEGLDFSRVTTFNLDEYYRLGPDHEQSYHRFMNENLFDLINVKKEDVHIPDGLTKDVDKFCLEYECMIKERGGIDIQLLGIGRDGHLGFNEPGSSLGSRTRLKTLTEETVRDNARFFSKAEEVPRLAITMGVGTILDAKKLLLVASGKGKAEAVRASIEGPVTSQVTASALQLHPHVICVVDEPASRLLAKKDYYRYVERIAENVQADARI
jgi:glucosamine-6-phosphate deaminase